MSAEQPAGNIHHIESLTVGGCLHNLFRHPYKTLCRRWNWKSALMSALIRGAIFFFANIVAGFEAAIGAMLIEFAFRIVASGFFGAMTQCFRRAEPAWAAAVCAILILPVANHAPELAIHWAGGTPELASSVGASLLFTVVSTLFSLYAMRNGVMVVGPQRHSILEDFRRMPGIVIGFASVAPRGLWRLFRPGVAASKSSANPARGPRERTSRADACAD